MVWAKMVTGRRKKRDQQEIDSVGNIRLQDMAVGECGAVRYLQASHLVVQIGDGMFCLDASTEEKRNDRDLKFSITW